MADEGPSAADSKAQAASAGKPDPGLKFLKNVKLSPREEEEYTTKARGDIPGLIAMESGGKEAGWKSVTTLFGVHVWSKPSEGGTPLMICRGRSQLPAEVTLDMLKTQFLKAYNNSRMLAQQMRSSDPMSRETKILCQIPCGEEEFIRIVWGAFAAVGVTWPRDFCFLQHATLMNDPKTGERLFAVVAGSIERSEVPDMEKLCKRIRSTVETSGYVFREAADGTVRATYVVNFNPNGWIPTKIVNTVAINQSLNVSRVKRKLAETAEAISAIGAQPPIFSTDLGWRCIEEKKIPRPAAGSAPVTVRAKFWGNGKVWFRIRGAGNGVTTEWKPAEASKHLGGAGWSSYSKHTAVSVEFALQACKETRGGANGAAAADDSELSDGQCVVLEWKAGGWFRGLSLYHVMDVV